MEWLWIWKFSLNIAITSVLLKTRIVVKNIYNKDKVKKIMKLVLVQSNNALKSVYRWKAHRRASKCVNRWLKSNLSLYQNMSKRFLHIFRPLKPPNILFL
jgi:hypothetical protein